MRYLIATPALALALVVTFIVDPNDWAMRLDEPKFWQPLSAIFVHSSVMHLFGNTVTLVFAGGVCEYFHGWRRTLLLFLYTGVAANLAYGWWRASELTTRVRAGGLLGASGAVYGIFGAHAAHLAINWAESVYLRVPWLTWLAIFVAVDIAAFVSAPSDRIAYTAHIMGAIHGLLVGFGVLRNSVVRSWEVPLRRIGLAVSVIIVGGSTAGFLLTP